MERIRGEAGTAVELTVRAGEDGTPRTLKITRGEVEIDAVSWTMVPGTTTGLRIEQFSNGVAEDVQKALQELRKEGADRLVLDLRGNPGGYVGEAVGTASQFLSSGTVYVERNAEGEEKATPVSPDGVDRPAADRAGRRGQRVRAEIVSGALQDNDCAEVVGATTFGTGTVLGEYALEDGSALRIGTVEWLTPTGGGSGTRASSRTSPWHGRSRRSRRSPATCGTSHRHACVHRGRAAQEGPELIEAD